jgi:glucan biosynthesis protein C
MHLWFLVDLIIYVLVGAWMLSAAGALMDRLGKRWKWGPFPLLLALTACTYVPILAVRMSGFAYVEPLGITQPLRLVSYFPYFAAGMLMYRVEFIRRVFFQINVPTLLVIAVPLAMAAAYVHAEHPRVAIEGGALVEILAKWMLVSGVIGAFLRWGSAPSRTVNLLADASYTVYLFHHAIVVALGILLMPVVVAGPYVKFLLVASATLLITLAIHRHLICRFKILRLLYNGRAD